MPGLATFVAGVDIDAGNAGAGAGAGTAAGAGVDDEEVDDADQKQNCKTTDPGSDNSNSTHRLCRRNRC